MATLHTSGVQQDVDAPAALVDLLNDPGDSLMVGEIQAEVVRRATRGSHCFDGALGGLRALERGQFLFNQSGSGPFAARLYAGKQLALKPVPVAGEAPDRDRADGRAWAR